MNKLSELLPGRISTEPEDLFTYGFDASGLNAPPTAIVWPQGVEDVVTVMKFAYDNAIPVIPRGAGTGMTGGAVPLQEAIVLSVERMNRILEIDIEDMNVLVEPGLINGRLQKELHRHGLFYPPDPASLNFCTIGGNVAENAGGPRAFKYGVTRDYVMGLEAVLPNGEIINTGVRTAKGVVGYDLTRLLVGSEGTLAVITKIRLKVLPEPEEVVALLALFGDLDHAGKTVQAIISKGLVPRTLEFLDGEAIRAVENYNGIGLPQGAAALLLIELDGYASLITKEAEIISRICAENEGEVIMAKDENAREKIWEARRAVSPALFHLMPSKINEDIVVPRKKITEMLRILKEFSKESGIKIVNFGHAGDGNIHVNLMVDRNDEKQYETARGLVKKIFDAALRLGGTISGEHGIGLTKSDYIGMEIPHEELEIMRQIKKIFDPKNILNPGKIFP